LKKEDKLTASEALYGFCGWLAMRKEKTVMSSSDDAAPIAELIDQFCKENGLAEPRKGWEYNLIHPSGECSGPVEDTEIREGFHILPQLAENSARRHDDKIPWEEERYPTRRCLKKIFEEAHEVKDALNDWTERPTKENVDVLMMEIEDVILSAYMLASKVDDNLNKLRRGRKLK